MRLPARVQRIPQGGGDLGSRMQRAFRRFPHAHVALVGCDIPDMRMADLQDAFRWMGTVDTVFGPADDGGYWLVAMTPRRPAQPFRNVRWSSEHALADTMVNFSNHRVARLRILQDIDTSDDFRLWQGRSG